MNKSYFKKSNFVYNVINDMSEYIRKFGKDDRISKMFLSSRSQDEIIFIHESEGVADKLK